MNREPAYSSSPKGEKLTYKSSHFVRTVKLVINIAIGLIPKLQKIMNNLIKKIIGYVVLFLIVIGLGVMLFKADYTKKTPQKATEELAVCLTEKGATMYGAEWCHFCKQQKDMFGAAFKKITYVECPDNEKLCTDLGIRGYPTWIFANGERSEGVVQFADLAAKTGCPYSPAN